MNKKNSQDDFMNYVGYNLYGGGDDPNFKSQPSWGSDLEDFAGSISGPLIIIVLLGVFIVALCGFFSTGSAGFAYLLGPYLIFLFVFLDDLKSRNTTHETAESKPKEKTKPLPYMDPIFCEIRSALSESIPDTAIKKVKFEDEYYKVTLDKGFEFKNGSYYCYDKDLQKVKKAVAGIKISRHK